MGGELIILTWSLGLFAFVFGLFVVMVGKVKLSYWSKSYLEGTKARVLGIVCIATSLIYLAVFYWAWSQYDR